MCFVLDHDIIVLFWVVVLTLVGTLIDLTLIDLTLKTRSLFLAFLFPLIYIVWQLHVTHTSLF